MRPTQQGADSPQGQPDPQNPERESDPRKLAEANDAAAGLHPSPEPDDPRLDDPSKKPAAPMKNGVLQPPKSGD